MRKTLVALIGFILVTITSFVSFLPNILNNTINFHTDEMYWMQTARILPYILDKKFQDPYWNENMGFVNFNGAKWVYAIGLRIFNYTDFSGIGIPPATYYNWNTYFGPFPKDNPLYPMLYHDRLISAFTASMAIGSMFVFGYILFPESILVGLAASVLLRIHPITIYIATHAFADSMFLLAEISWASLLSYMMKYSHYSRRWLISLGVILGYAISVKINAGMFYFITIFLIAIGKINSLGQYMRRLFVITLSAGITFMLLHPNFFFFPSYTVYQMIVNRFLITQYQMEYFSAIDPPSVLHSIPQRAQSFINHLFTPIVQIFFTIGSMYSLFVMLKKRDTQQKELVLLWITIGIILEFLLAYVVFDDQRYVIPLLPFICLMSSSWLIILSSYLKHLVHRHTT